MKKEKKNRYSPDELGEFEKIINGKLEKARTELNYIKESLSKRNDSGTDTTASTIKILEAPQNSINIYRSACGWVSPLSSLPKVTQHLIGRFLCNSGLFTIGELLFVT